MAEEHDKNNVFNLDYINLLSSLNSEDAKEINKITNSFYDITTEEIKTYACINGIDLDEKGFF